MEQLGIFDPVPRARRSDPETSHQAAARASNIAVSHRNRIMSVLRGRMTVKEIAAALGDIDYVAVGKRTPELQEMGLARPTDEKRNGCRCWERVG